MAWGGAVRPLRAAAGAVVGSTVLICASSPMAVAMADVHADDRARHQRAEDYRAALEAHFAGDQDEAAARFGALTEDGPGHELAEEYLADPPRAAAPPDDRAGVEPGVLLGLAGAVVVGTGAAVVVRRRRSALSAGRSGTVPAQRRPAEELTRPRAQAQP